MSGDRSPFKLCPGGSWYLAYQYSARTRLAVKNKVQGEPYRARNHQRHLAVFRVLWATAKEAWAYRIAPSNVQEACGSKD